MIQNKTKRRFPFLTTEQAGELLGIGERAVGHRCRAGYLPGVKIGKEEGRGGAVWLIHEDDIRKAVGKFVRQARKGKKNGKRKART